MAAPNGGVPNTEATPAETSKTGVSGTSTPLSEATNGSGTPKEMSKRALEKLKKKAAKAEKKAEYALRPKETQKETKPKSIFEEGWLKQTFEAKTVPPGKVQTRFPPEPNVCMGL